MNIYFKIWRIETQKNQEKKVIAVSPILSNKIELINYFKQNLDVVKNSHNHIICGYNNIDCSKNSAIMVLKEWLMECGLFQKQKEMNL